jgi:adenine phosphoribosyltransferase
MDLKTAIREVPDFPKKGISFKDITTLLKNPKAFRFAVHSLLKRFKDKRIDAVAGIESRGFVLAAPMALKLKIPLILVRKPGKLPAAVKKKTYSLEYGTDAVEIHVDAVSKGMRILLIDDLIATGGTAQAAAELIEELGGEIAGLGFVVELPALGGRKKLAKYRVATLVQYADVE